MATNQKGDHMRKHHILRLTALTFSLLLLLAACGGDDGGEATGDTAGGATEPADAAGGAATEPEAMTEAPAGGTEAAGGGDNEAVAALQEAGTVRVGTKFDQPLFGVQTPGGVEGFDAEIAKLIVEGIFQDGDPASHTEFIEAVSANREPFLQNDQVDMVVATYTINDERDEIVDFAGPYYVAGQDIMVPADNPNDIQGIEDLNTADFTTCTVEGSTSLENLQEMAPDADILTFDTYSKCADAMRDGRAGAVTTDNVILLGLVEESGGEFVLVENPFTEEPYGIGVPEGSPLRCFVNQRLMEIYDSGEWAEAYEATVGQVAETTPEPPEVNNEGC